MEKEVYSDRHGVDGAYVYTKIVRIKPRLAKTKKKCSAVTSIIPLTI